MFVLLQMSAALTKEDNSQELTGTTEHVTL